MKVCSGKKWTITGELQDWGKGKNIDFEGLDDWTYYQYALGMTFLTRISRDM